MQYFVSPGTVISSAFRLLNPICSEHHHYQVTIFGCNRGKAAAVEAKHVHIGSKQMLNLVVLRSSMLSSKSYCLHLIYPFTSGSPSATQSQPIRYLGAASEKSALVGRVTVRRNGAMMSVYSSCCSVTGNLGTRQGQKRYIRIEKNR